MSNDSNLEQTLRELAEKASQQTPAKSSRIQTIKPEQKPFYRRGWFKYASVFLVGLAAPFLLYTSISPLSTKPNSIEEIASEYISPAKITTEASNLTNPENAIDEKPKSNIKTVTYIPFKEGDSVPKEKENGYQQPKQSAPLDNKITINPEDWGIAEKTSNQEQPNKPEPIVKPLAEISQKLVRDLVKEESEPKNLESIITAYRTREKKIIEDYSCQPPSWKENSDPDNYSKCRASIGALESELSAKRWNNPAYQKLLKDVRTNEILILNEISGCYSRKAERLISKKQYYSAIELYKEALNFVEEVGHKAASYKKTYGSGSDILNAYNDRDGFCYQIAHIYATQIKNMDGVIQWCKKGLEYNNPRRKGQFEQWIKLAEKNK